MREDFGRHLSAVSMVEDPFLRRFLKTTLHVRRYFPFYVFGVIWVLTLTLFPTMTGPDERLGESTAFSDVETDDGASVVSDEAPVEATPDADSAAGPAPSTPGAARSSRPGGGGRAASVQVPPSATIDSQQAAQAIQQGTGVTRGGVECKPGVLQIPGTVYAAPCQAKYEGPNGGATSRGVNDKEIVIVRRSFPESANSQAVAAVGEQAGAAPRDVAREVRDVFVDYFNRSFELYGRQLVFKDYESQNGDGTAEAQSKGKEGACLDADEILERFKPFMVYSGSQPFGECAAERKLVVNGAGAYFPETWYRKYHPYLWNGVTDCERLTTYNAEYVGKKLLGKTARWAKDPVIAAKTRKFGIYIPDNDQYQLCGSNFKRQLMEKYGAKGSDFAQYNYVLDVSRMPDQAAQGIVQFAAAGVTTITTHCDPISTILLTQAAVKQNYGPEWFNTGVAGNDVDSLARLMHQGSINGHFFGQSQLSSNARLFGPRSQPGVVYKMVTGKEIPDGTSGDFFTLALLFSKFQATGPVVTPSNWATGTWSLPAMGAPDFAVGLVDYKDGYDGKPDHTAIDDSREIYWVCDGSGETCTGTSSDPYFNGDDGKNGTFKETMGGKRLNIGQWTAEEPQVYPPR